MSQLVPCSGCGRHVRLSSTSCPFCDVALDVNALDERYAPRRNGVSSGMKRAAIFAIGAGMAAACGGETGDGTPDPDPSVQPIYGAPIPDTTDETSGDSESSADPGPTAQPLYGAPVGPADTEGNAQPLYGAPVPVDTEGNAQPLYGAPVPVDTEGNAQPLYGAPVNPDDRTDGVSQPVYGAPVTEDIDRTSETEAAIDGGVAPPEDDAGKPVGTDGPIAVPLYGAPPLTQ